MSRAKESRRSSIRELKPVKRPVEEPPQPGGEAPAAAELDEAPAEAEAEPEPAASLDASEEAFEAVPAEADGDNTEAFLCGLIEALLFSSDRPMPAKEIARSAGIDRRRAEELVAVLRQRHEHGGLCIEEVAGGYVMRSSPRYAVYIQKLLALRPVRLSRAQLETLAIIAYRQPVTKPEVDDIRGVDSGQVIKGLLERDLLKILGKKDEPGRPMLYGTTTGFLELLNLQSLKDLPTLREYTELSEESRRKFSEETGEDAVPIEGMEGAEVTAAPEIGTEPDADQVPAAVQGDEDGSGEAELADRSEAEAMPASEERADGTD
jgi:segregation and condensation protein B